MAGLVPAIHVVPRIERPQTARDIENLDLQALAAGRAVTLAFAAERGKPGHDDKGSKAQSRRPDQQLAL
jgi:hypothetical protein